MKRRENYIKKSISALTLAGMLAVSVCPLSASAENMPDSAVPAEEHEASSAADLSEDNGGLQEDENKSAAAEGAEGENSGGGSEVTEQAGEEEPEKENEAGGVQNRQDNLIQLTGEGGREQCGSGQNEEQSEDGGQQSGNIVDTVPSDTAFSQTDAATGICAEAAAGVFPAGTLMIVTPLAEGGNYDLLQTLLSAAADQFQVCDISFFSVSAPDFSDMKPVQPQGNVKIQMPVPEGYDLSRLAVYHISTDGGMTEIPFELQNGSAVFETDRFSLYALLEQKETQTDLPSSLEMTDKISRLDLNRTHNGDSSGAGDGSGTSARLDSGAGFSEYSSPQTGDNLNEKALVSRLFLMSAALLVSVGTVRAGCKRKKAAEGTCGKEN